MIKKYKRRNYYIDLYNSGIVGIMNGIKHWNTETNSTAYKYIKLYILGEIMDEIKNNYEMTRDEMEKLANEITTEKFKYDDMLESVMMLDDENKQIMTMYAYGYSFGEIAVEMNSKEHTIRRQYNKLIKTMRL
jgi:RNA polymerase sigma factor (sigma-70 family)